MIGFDLVEFAPERDPTYVTGLNANRIVREAEVTGFQAYVVDLIRKTLPAEIRFTRMQLRAELDENDEDILYDLVFDGTADDSNHAARLVSKTRSPVGDVSVMKTLSFQIPENEVAARNGDRPSRPSNSFSNPG